jgi:hypothetical protein
METMDQIRREAGELLDPELRERVQRLDQSFRNLAREYPVVSVAGAFLVGFVAARLFVRRW